MGLGATLRKANVGIDRGGLCAEAFEAIEKAITETAKRRASAIAKDLRFFSEKSIFFFPYCCKNSYSWDAI
jgi:hypothetical protein